MSEITVLPLGPQRYGVEVAEGDVRTTHKVMVSADFLDDLGVADVDPLAVVHEAFAYLLDREPASAIRGDFPIDQIAEHHPDFYDELRTRLTG